MSEKSTSRNVKKPKVVMSLGEAAAAAVALTNSRVSQQTQKGYLGHMKRMSAWAKEAYQTSTLVDKTTSTEVAIKYNNEGKFFGCLALPISHDLVINYFGYMSEKRAKEFELENKSAPARVAEPCRSSSSSSSAHLAGEGDTSSKRKRSPSKKKIESQLSQIGDEAEQEEEQSSDEDYEKSEGEQESSEDEDEDEGDDECEESLEASTQVAVNFMNRIKNTRQPKRMQPTLAKNYMDAQKSALKWYYAEHTVKFPEDLESALSKILQGYKKKVAKMKKDGKMRNKEGKSALVMEGYERVAERCLLLTPEITFTENCKGGKQVTHTHPFKASIFVWAFLVIMWNNMGRSVNVADLLISNIKMEGDALVTDASMSKTDQQGDKDYARKNYANPLKPWICPFLALGVLIFTRQRFEGSQKGSAKLFEGQHQESRFGKILGFIIATLSKSDVHKIGGCAVDMGTHSIRKGSASYCIGIVGGPSAVAVCLRAMWSLGDVLNRYIFQGGGADAYVGRTVTGLPANESLFAILPPHFDREADEELAEKWNTYFPGFDALPADFKGVIPFLAASLVYHEEYLRANLNKRHPIFSTQLFTSDFVRKYKDRVLLGSGTCENTGLVASGVPPHVVQSLRMDALDKSVKANILSLQEEIKELGEKQNEACEKILSKIDYMHEQTPILVAEKIKDSFEVQGVKEMTKDDVRQLITGALQDGQTQMKQLFEENFRLLIANTNAAGREAPLAAATAPLPPQALQVPAAEGAPVYAQFNWAADWDKQKQSRFQYVPKDFEWPTGINTRDVFLHWYFGIPNQRIAPLRKIDFRYGFNQRKDWVYHSKVKFVMRLMEDYLVNMGKMDAETDISTLSMHSALALFEIGIKQVTRIARNIQEGEDDNDARDPPSIGTLRNSLGKALNPEKWNKKRKNEEEKEHERENRQRVQAVDATCSYCFRVGHYSRECTFEKRVREEGEIIQLSEEQLLQKFGRRCVNCLRFGERSCAEQCQREKRRAELVGEELRYFVHNFA